MELLYIYKVSAKQNINILCWAILWNQYIYAAECCVSGVPMLSFLVRILYKINMITYYLDLIISIQIDIDIDIDNPIFRG